MAGGPISQSRRGTREAHHSDIRSAGWRSNLRRFRRSVGLYLAEGRMAMGAVGESAPDHIHRILPDLYSSRFIIETIRYLPLHYGNRTFHSADSPGLCRGETALETHK